MQDTRIATAIPRVPVRANWVHLDKAEGVLTNREGMRYSELHVYRVSGLRRRPRPPKRR